MYMIVGIGLIVIVALTVYLALRGATMSDSVDDVNRRATARNGGTRGDGRGYASPGSFFGGGDDGGGL